MMLKRIGSCLIALLCIPLLFSACKAEQPQLPNPVVDVDGPEAFVPILGTKLRALDDADDVSYTAIDNRIAQIQFTYGGNAYSYRAANASEGDISGVYDEFSDDQVNISLESDGTSTAILLRFLSDGSRALATWNIGENTFSLFSKNTADENTVSYVATGLARLAAAATSTPKAS
ncbi:MAG: hypothetical protein AAGU74_11505 [Bacillota bacterium]